MAIAIKYFRALRDTHRFRKNQKVWIRTWHHNHYDIRFKFRGKGRYISGIIDNSSPAVGEIKEIEVEDGFAKRTQGEL